MHCILESSEPQCLRIKLVVRNLKRQIPNKKIVGGKVESLNILSFTLFGWNVGRGKINIYNIFVKHV